MFWHKSDYSSLGDPVINPDRYRRLDCVSGHLASQRHSIPVLEAWTWSLGLQGFCSLASSRLCGSCLWAMLLLCVSDRQDTGV